MFINAVPAWQKNNASQLQKPTVNAVYENNLYFLREAYEEYERSVVKIQV